MISEQLWAYFDLGSVITIGGVIVAVIKYGKGYVQHIKDELREIKEINSEFKEHNKRMELSLLRNDLKLLMRNNASNEEVSEVYDLYIEHGGNSYLSKMVHDYKQKK